MGETNLPTRLDSFVGREVECNRLRALLDESRLITLTGPGGVGKTRLGIEFARELSDVFPNGIWFIDLAPFTDDTFGPHVVTEAVGLHGFAGQDQKDQLVTFLSSSRTLLLLDNCEHIVRTVAPFIQGIAEAASTVHVIATSREPLRLPGEAVLNVPPLSIPSNDPLLEEADGEAVDLFLERALSYDVSLDLRAARSEVASICRRLDGLPLAIELAAARLRSLSIDDLAASLDARFSILTEGSRTAAARQQTLLMSVQWSYDLLSTEEQAVFRRLAVFAGHFSTEAAIAVCNDAETPKVQELFLGLVERSLVQMERSRAWAPYRLLEGTSVTVLAEFGPFEVPGCSVPIARHRWGT